MTIDLGAGDGKAALRAARRDPGRLFVAIDADARGLVQASRDAARKITRGGAPNVLFVLAAAERLPRELRGSAADVTITLPWGSLLAAVWRPEASLLVGVRGLCRAGARITVVVAFDETRDHDAARAVGRDPSDLGPLAAGYSEAGFHVEQITKRAGPDLAALGTTWANRLAARRSGQAWRLTARAG